MLECVVKALEVLMCRIENQGGGQQVGWGGLLHRDLAVAWRPPNGPPKMEVTDGNPGGQAVLKVLGWAVHLWLKMVWGQNFSEYVWGEQRKKRTVLWVRTRGQVCGPWWRPRQTPTGEWHWRFPVGLSLWAGRGREPER